MTSPQAPVTREFVKTPPLRKFRIQLMVMGTPFHWTGEATGEADARLQAITDIAGHYPGHFFNRNARVVECCEVTA